MIRYKVGRAFVDYGIYRGVGEIISDVSMINSLEVKLSDNTLVEIDDEGNVLSELITDIEPPKTPETPVASDLNPPADNTENPIEPEETKTSNVVTIKIPASKN